MDLKHKQTRAADEIAAIEGQLQMYGRIKGLSNVNFDIQIKALERRIEHLRQAVAFYQQSQRAM